MKRLVPGTLRFRLQLLLLAVLIPILLLILASAWVARVREREQVQSEALRLADLAARAQARTIESTSLLLSALEFVHSEDEGCRRELAGLVDSFDRFLNLGLIGPGDTLLCTARPATGGATGRDWLRDARRSRRLVVSRLESGFAGSSPALVFARAIDGQDGLVSFAALDPRWISRSLLESDLPENSSVAVVDDDGTVLARYPEHDRWVGRDVGQVPAIREARRLKTGAAEAEGVDGIVRLFGFTTIAFPNRDVSLLVGIPREAAYGPMNRRLRAVFAGLALVTIVSVAVARVGVSRVTARLERLVDAAARLSAGDLDARTRDGAQDEVGALSRTFDEMAETVAARTRDLEEMTEALRALAARLDQVREQERTRISREIHDELGQALTGIRMDIDRLEERLARAGLSDADRAPLAAKLESVRALAGSALATSRRISRELRPSVLDVLGLQAAVEWQLEEFQNRTGAETQLDGEEHLAGIREPVSTVMFRVIQEALTNVMRHARARRVSVRIDRPEGDLRVRVSDDGVGFDPAARSAQHSLGLLGIRERASAIGGSADIQSTPGQGTVVEVRVPATPEGA